MIIDVTKESLRLAKDDQIFWARPLILGLEEKKRHLAIRWVVYIVKGYVEGVPNSNKELWMDWLQELEEIISKSYYNETEYLAQRSRKIFNAPTSRNVYLTLMSHMYAAECLYRSDKYELYIRRLWDALGLANDKFSTISNSEYQRVIGKYIDWWRIQNIG